MKSALIIFVRNRVLGKVKTRLAAKLGDAEALKAYTRLLLHTQEIVKAVPAHKFIFYDGFVEEQGWPAVYKACVQTGTDLGRRMAGAFEQVFTWGFEKVAIIGSDCLELNTAIIEQAFAALDRADVAIGPAKDGGYYLLALKQNHPALFQHIAWSTPAVLAQTRNACRQHLLTVSLLPALADIDEAEDWIKAKAALDEQ